MGKFAILKSDSSADKKTEAIYTTCYNMVIMTILPIVKCRATAEDLASNVFIKIYNKIQEFEFQSEPQLKSWVRIIAYNTAIDYFRKKKVKVDSEMIEPYHENSYLSERIEKEYIQELKDELEKLPEKYLVPLKLRIKGYTYKEISEKLNWTMSKTKSALHMGRSKIKKQLK